MEWNGVLIFTCHASIHPSMEMEIRLGLNAFSFNIICWIYVVLYYNYEMWKCEMPTISNNKTICNIIMHVFRSKTLLLDILQSYIYYMPMSSICDDVNMWWVSHQLQFTYLHTYSYIYECLLIEFKIFQLKYSRQKYENRNYLLSKPLGWLICFWVFKPNICYGIKMEDDRLFLESRISTIITQ